MLYCYYQLKIVTGRRLRMQRIGSNRNINMNGVKRFKVRNKKTWEIIDRFFTLEEAEEFRSTLDIETVIAWD